MAQDQSIMDHYAGLIIDLQKRVYALEREVRTLRTVRKPEPRKR